jgi:Uma2 family endonuclease
MITASTQNMTDEQYLLFAETAMVRHELFHSNLLEMPGATVYHERLIKNLYRMMSILTFPENLELFFSGMKLNIPGRNSYFYPDLMVGFVNQKDPRFFKDAIFIAEVLSPGTRSFDMADKFLEYRNLPSLQYYLLAEPEYYHVTLQYKTKEGVWMSETYRKLTDIIKLPLIGADLPLAEIYKGLEWD